MIKAKFSDCTEIRMGSPYNLCKLSLSGEWTPELPYQDWQNLYAQSEDGRILALIAWDIEHNKPGFRVVIVNARKHTITSSDRIPGCCHSIVWEGFGFKYETFGWLSIS